MTFSMNIHPEYKAGEAKRLKISTHRPPSYDNGNATTLQIGDNSFTLFDLTSQDAELLFHVLDMDDDQRADLLEQAREINPDAPSSSEAA